MQLNSSNRIKKKYKQNRIQMERKNQTKTNCVFTHNFGEKL